MRLLHDDAISEIIEGMDPNFIHRAKEYFTWICEQANGTTILDFGSYRGIISLILAKHGKKVRLIVTDPQDKQYIDNYWDVSILNNIEVEFYESSFQSNTIVGGPFDTVILTERGYFIEDVLDNIVGYRQICSNGRLIISRPFGLFGAETEKPLSYGIELAPLLSHGFTLKNLELLGGYVDLQPHYWMCFSFDRTGERFEINPSLKIFLEKTETLFEKKDRAFNEIVLGLVEKIEDIRLMHDKLDNDVSLELKNAILMLGRVGSKIDIRFPKLLIESEEGYSIESNMETKDDEVTDVEPQIVESAQDSNSFENYEVLKRKIDIAVMKLNESINILNNELIEEERLLTNYNELKIKYEKLESKYDSLSNSKSVKMTLAVWNFFKRKPAKK